MAARLDSTTVVTFVALVGAVVLHEVSHGVVALWRGDDTAKNAGRLTLNPVPHLDPFGSLILPAMGAVVGAPVIGWARPVPVRPTKLRRGARDLPVVALAGPLANLLLMAVAAAGARVFLHAHRGDYVFVRDLPLGARFLLLFAEVNLFLGVFNLLPIPPLDGAKLVDVWLPARHLRAWRAFEPYGMLVLFLLVFSTGLTSQLIDPLLRALLRFVSG